MINTSNEYKAVIAGNNRQFYGTAEITLADSTVLNLDNSRIKQLKTEDATSQSGKFTALGAAIINKHTLVIDNHDDAYSGYDFTDAVIRPSVGLHLSETIETLHKGVYTSDDPKSIGPSITLTALDNMVKFDKPFSGVTQSFPCDAGTLLQSVCTHCGVILATTTFLNDDFEIQTRPDDEATSCREVVSWIAADSGNFARCNTDGALELQWYDFEVFEELSADGGYFDETEEESYQSGDNLDGGDFTDYSSGDSFDGGSFNDFDRCHHIYALTQFQCSTDDVVITGIQVTSAEEEPHTVLYGSTGYVLSIEGNQLIQSESDAAVIANSVGAKIVGMRFRPMSLSAISDPSREAGDIAHVSDRKGNVYQTLLTSVNFSINQNDRIACDAEPPIRNSATRYSEVAKAVIETRKNTAIQLSRYDLVVQHYNTLMARGGGMYETQEPQPDGSIIRYIHDKPTIAESDKIYTINSNGVFISTDHGVTWGVDFNGNQLVNTLTATDVNADRLRVGKIWSTDGDVLIDLEKGVVNSDNVAYTDNVQSAFPLYMDFNIDAATSEVKEVKLKYTQRPFRTYSSNASSGGGSSQTSTSGGGINTTVPYSSTATTFVNATGTVVPVNNMGSASGSTNIVNPPSGTPHSHTFDVPYHPHSGELPQHVHNFPLEHSHGLIVPGHTHQVDIPPHTHLLNFGIQEQAISNYAMDIYVDGTLRVQIINDVANAQGVIDLTPWVSTTGWHTIEVRSTTLKRVSAQINIKSYIRR